MELVILLIVVGISVAYSKWHNFQMHLFKKKYKINSFEDFLNEQIEWKDFKRYENEIYEENFELNSFKIFVREFEYSDFNYAILHQMLLMYASNSYPCNNIYLHSDDIGFNDGGYVYRLKRSPITNKYLRNDFSYLREWQENMGRDNIEKKPISATSNEHVYINATLYVHVSGGLTLNKTRKLILKIFDVL